MKRMYCQAFLRAISNIANDSVFLFCTRGALF
jgi:hypothetical protein